MSKWFVPATLILLSLLAVAIAERRLDNSKEQIEARDSHAEESRPKKVFAKPKRQKSQYGPPKVVHQPKKPQYGPPPYVHGPPQPIGYGPPPNIKIRPPPYPSNPPQPIAYSRPVPVYSQPGPPKSNYAPPIYASSPQIVYNRPSPVYPKPVLSPPVYSQPIATYSQPAPPEPYNPPPVHVAKPEVAYSPSAPSYSLPQIQVTQPVHYQPASSYTAHHDDGYEDDRKPSGALPLTTVYNIPLSSHVKLPTPSYGAPKPHHYEPAEPKPIVTIGTPIYIKAELTGNRYEKPAEQLPETPVYEPPSSAYGSSQPESNPSPVDDDPPKQTEYTTKRSSYSEDSNIGPTDSSSSTKDEDEKFSPPSESDFPSLFDPSSDFYKQSEKAPDTNDFDFGFFQLGVFPKTSNFFEENYKG